MENRRRRSRTPGAVSASDAIVVRFDRFVSELFALHVSSRAHPLGLDYLVGDRRLPELLTGLSGRFSQLPVRS